MAKTSADALKKSYIFEQFTDADIKQLTDYVKEIEMPPSKVVLAENMAGKGLYLISAGQVEVIKAHGAGEPKPLALLMEGDCFGEISLIDDAPHSAVVRSLTDCTFLVIERPEFNRLQNENPRLAYKIAEKILKTVCFRLRQTNEQVINMAAWISSKEQLR